MVEERGRRIAVVGRRGAGRTTQALMLAARSGAAHLAIDDLVGAAAVSGTRLGNRVAEHLDRGSPMPADLLATLIAERLTDPLVRGKGFVLDGFPQAVAHVRALEDIGVLGRGSLRTLDVIVQLVVPQQVVRERLGGRPHVDPASLARNMADHDAKLRPMLEWYAGFGRLRVVDGEGSRDQVAQRLWQATLDRDRRPAVLA